MHAGRMRGSLRDAGNCQHDGARNPVRRAYRAAMLGALLLGWCLGMAGWAHTAAALPPETTSLARRAAPAHLPEAYSSASALYAYVSTRVPSLAGEGVPRRAPFSASILNAPSATHAAPLADMHLLTPYLKGIASWYGPGFHGRQTSNGERYDQHGITAAHPYLPLGAWIEVRNLENNQRLRMRVNDRGPYARKRILDLSFGAAKQLGVLKAGTAPVEITVLAWPAHLPPGSSLRPYFQYAVQIGSFQSLSQTRLWLNRLIRKHSWGDFRMEPRPGNFSAVVLGPFDQLSQAQTAENRLRRSGEATWIRRWSK